MSARLVALAALAAGALLAACGREQPPAPPRAREAAPPPGREEPPAFEGTVLALGDSLTAGFGLPPDEAWPAVLEGRLRAAGLRWRVVNAGVSGETSSGTLSRVDWVLRVARPDVVVLATGANDGLRGIDPGLLRENLVGTVERLRAGGATVVLAGMRMVRNLGAAYTREFEAVYPRVAAETGAPLVPFLLEGVAAVPSLNQADGIHPTAAGHRVIAATIEPAVVAAIAAREGKGREAGPR